MNITFYGHACFGIEVNGIHIIVDPFITGNPKASHIDDAKQQFKLKSKELILLEIGSSIEL